LAWTGRFSSLSNVHRGPALILLRICFPTVPLAALSLFPVQVLSFFLFLHPYASTCRIPQQDWMLLISPPE